MIILSSLEGLLRLSPTVVLSDLGVKTNPIDFIEVGRRDT